MLPFCYYICQHGIPCICDDSTRSTPPTQDLLHSILDEGMCWHACLLRSLAAHGQRPDITKRQDMSMRTKLAWVNEQKNVMIRATHATEQGFLLIMERDTGKRTFDKMSAREQHILQDYHTDKITKQLHAINMLPDKAFCGMFHPTYSSSATKQTTEPSTGSATEHTQTEEVTIAQYKILDSYRFNSVRD